MSKNLNTTAQIGDYSFDRLINETGAHYACYLTADEDADGTVRGALTTVMYLTNGLNHIQHDDDREGAR